jgi:hypothetical protein
MNDGKIMDKLKKIDIRTVWEEIRPKLETIREEMRADWRPEDLYALCVNEHAALFAEQGEGFVILQRLFNVTLQAHYLYIVAAWGEGFARQKHWPRIEALGRTEGCAYVEALSLRRGFERTGWSLEHVCYRRRL